MKKSNRYIKKLYKRFINKKSLNYIINHSSICKHAAKELELAGYKKHGNCPSSWMYRHVMESVAMFSCHDNSGSSAPIELKLVEKLCSFDIISPLRFTDDEWIKISNDGDYQNKRKSTVFKNPNGRIEYIDAFVKKPIRRYSFNTKTWTCNDKPIIYHGRLFEHKDGFLTGRHFNKCFIPNIYIEQGLASFKKVIINCDEIEIAPDNWIMTVDCRSVDIKLLESLYDIDWRESKIINGIKVEDVIPELEMKVLNEFKNI